jgi:hypothetical protein
VSILRDSPPSQPSTWNLSTLITGTYLLPLLDSDSSAVPPAALEVALADEIDEDVDDEAAVELDEREVSVLALEVDEVDVVLMEGMDRVVEDEDVVVWVDCGELSRRVSYQPPIFASVLAGKNTHG